MKLFERFRIWKILFCWKWERFERGRKVWIFLSL